MLYAKDAKRQRRKRSAVGTKLLPVNASDVSRGGFSVVRRNSDGSQSVVHIYRCAHCQEYRGTHVDGKHCLFMPTTFREMTDEEAVAAFTPETLTLTYSTVTRGNATITIGYHWID